MFLIIYVSPTRSNTQQQWLFNYSFFHFQMHANETTTYDEGETRREVEEQNQQTEVKTLLL